MALKRAFRLRKSSEFLRVRQQGRSFTSRLLILAFVTNEIGTTRVGFVVSKRVSKHAVVRNYSKRLLSEAMRPLLPRLPNGLDIVLTVRNGAAATLESNPGALKQEVVMLLRRAHLLDTGQSEPSTDTSS